MTPAWLVTASAFRKLANSPPGAKNCSTFPGSQNVVSQGYNLSDDDSLGVYCPMIVQSSDQSNTNPKLDRLLNHGGPATGPFLEPMLTHLPLPGSPAIDQILGGFNGCGTTFQIDQRGVQRPQDGDGNGGYACDIGALEYRPGEIISWLYMPLIRR